MTKESILKTLQLKGKGPGPIIKEQLEVRGWTQEDLSDIFDMSLKTINKLLLNKQSITIDTAELLTEVFGSTPQYWINLDTNYRLSLRSQNIPEPNSLVKIRSELYTYMPVNELFKRGWLSRTNDKVLLEKQVLDFWKMKTLDFSFMEDKTKASANYRKSDAHAQFNKYAAETWCQMVKNSTSLFFNKRYNKNKLETLYDELHSFTLKEKGVEEFLLKLNEAGVTFMYLPHLQKTYIDGAALLVKGSPVIVYTGRYKRYDNFWYTLTHEIAHILLGHVTENNCRLDDFHEKDDQPTDEKESEANELASKKLFHNEIMDFFNDTLNYITVEDISECAQKFEVHPAIIVGALAHRKVVSFVHLHKFNEDVLPLIPEKYWVEKLITTKAA